MKCTQCQWDIHPLLDRFCGGCCRELVRIRVDNPQGTSEFEVFPGAAIEIDVTNTGDLPLRLFDSHCEWPVSQVPACELSPGEQIRLVAYLEGDVPPHRTTMLNLDTNAGTVALLLRRVTPPQLTVKVEQTALSPGEDTINGTLLLPASRARATRYVVLVGVEGGEDRLLEAELRTPQGPLDQLKLAPLLSAQSLTPINAIRLELLHDGELVLHAPLVQLHLRTQRQSSVFNFQLKQFLEPVFTLYPSRQFIGDSAIRPGSSHHETFHVLIENAGTRVTFGSPRCDAPWLIFKNTSVPESGDTPWNVTDSAIQKYRMDLAIDLAQLPLDVQRLETHVRIPYSVGDLDHRGELSIPVPLELQKRQSIPFLAIDFGTSNTCLAFTDPYNGRRQVVKFPVGYSAIVRGGSVRLNDVDDQPGAYANAEVPTLLFLASVLSQEGQEDTLEFELAPGVRLRYSADRAAGTAYAWKKRLGQDQPLPLTSRNTVLKWLSAEALTTIFLQQALAVFQRQFPYDPRNLIITHPVHFAGAQCGALEQVGKSLGFNRVSLRLSEPEALALHIITDPRYRGRFKAGETYTIGVFDFGGGTTDLAILRFRCEGDGLGECEVLDAMGLPNLGGEDLTFDLARFLHRRIEAYYQAEGSGLQFPFPEDLSDLLSTRATVSRDNAAKLSKVAESFKCAYDGLPRREAMGPDLKEIFSRTVFTTLPDEFTTEIDGSLPRDLVESLHKPLETATGETDPEIIRLMLCQEDIDEVCAPPIERAFVAFNNMKHGLLQDNAIASSFLDFMILGGNSARLPLVERLAHDARAAKEMLHFPLEAKSGVAIGAAKYGELLQDPECGLAFKPFSGLHKTVGIAQGLKFRPLFEKGTAPGSQFAMDLVRGEYIDELRLFIKSVFDRDNPAGEPLQDATFVGAVPLEAIDPGEAFSVMFTVSEDAGSLLYQLARAGQVFDGEIALIQS